MFQAGLQFVCQSDGLSIPFKNDRQFCRVHMRHGLAATIEMPNLVTGVTPIQPSSPEGLPFNNRGKPFGVFWSSTFLCENPAKGQCGSGSA